MPQIREDGNTLHDPLMSIETILLESDQKGPIYINMAPEQKLRDLNGR